MFLITGSGLNVKLLPLMFIETTLIGPWMTGPPWPVRKNVELGRHQSDAWNVIPCPVQLTAVAEFDRSVANVSMSVFAVLPCQFENTQLVFWAQIVVLLFGKEICPAAMITPIPLYVIDCDTLIGPSMKTEPL